MQPAPPPLPQLALQPGALNSKIESLREKLAAQKRQKEMAEAAARAAGTAAPTVEERPLQQSPPAFASPPGPPPPLPPAPTARGGEAPDGFGQEHPLPPLPTEPCPTSGATPPLPQSGPQVEAPCAPEPPPAAAQEQGPVLPFPAPESPPNSSVSLAPGPDEPLPPGLGSEPSSATAAASAGPGAANFFQPAVPPPIPASAGGPLRTKITPFSLEQF
eukprot:1106586-Pelagomonas_calceolata.AAC.3